ncbi:hypothetical protein K0I73_09420 [Shewanella mesophila]|uniref:hypothetical protein n=1 Tax=Shewanella mesophila TaxID=2864208 RepID=UPI001C65F846|nr:hypothetical protein [Shewanella mesophila]QYJ87851.1 hypothetical protein K0I73_09340 [Shewanella mesophila]QYJ87859.1 hypothetical protein K0I73_09380 [Shewanella mesophila]QYJ87867.1 hypothetical protein K0I73_09420 [Shewanella mesophila]
MSKLITGSLMLALSAFSFFCNAEFSENMPDWVEPESDNSETYSCRSNYISYDPSYVQDSRMSLSDCIQTLRSIGPQGSETTRITECNNVDISREIHLICGTEVRQVPSYPWVTGGNVNYGKAHSKIESDSKICPPNDFPDYKKGPMPEPGNESHEVCFPNFPLCPLGYFKYSVEPYGCVPIQCPSKGEVSSSIQTFGKVPVAGSGTYCDGQCSYSINNGASYKGAQWTTGVSNGAVCGNGKIESNASFTPEDKEGDCTTHELSNGLTYQDCSNVTVPDEGDGNNNGGGIDDGIDTTENEVEETSTDSPYDGVDCSTVGDKTTCIGKNIVDAISDQSNKLKKDAAERHNKLIKQQKEITEYVERQIAEREAARSNDARQVVDGLEGVRQAIVSGGSGAGGGGSSNDGVISAIDGLGESLGETGVETDSEPSQGIQSFYEPEYPNGFSDVWSKNSSALKSSAPFEFVKQFENIAVSGSAPPMEFCFNLGSLMNYGCNTLELDARVLGFLFAINMICTAFAVRKIIFGG